MNQAVIEAKKVVKKKEICGGVPLLQGTRIRVSDIVVEYDHKGLSPEEIAREFPSLSLADVFSALTYYYEHPEEIRSEIERREHRIANYKAS